MAFSGQSKGVCKHLPELENSEWQIISLKKTTPSDIEPAEFEDLSQEATGQKCFVRIKHGRKSNQEVTEHPFAKNLIRNNTARR